MKTEYQHIHFIPVNRKGKTSVWHCHNNQSVELLGEIKWYAPWRQYCYFTIGQAVYSVSCHQDINDFIGQL
jgi:hypothetical protein